MILKLKVGKSYDREDGEVVKIVYGKDCIFLGVIDMDKNFITNYYNFKGADSCNRPNFDLVREHSMWSNVKKDTLVVVYDAALPYHLRYFDKYEHGKVYVFREGRTSYTSHEPSEARGLNEVKLYNKEEAKPVVEM